MYFENNGYNFSKFLSGTREMAFVHAISSAGVAHALTRACSSGELENCGCDRSLRGMSPEGFQVLHYIMIFIYLLKFNDYDIMIHYQFLYYKIQTIDLMHCCYNIRVTLINIHF